MSSRQGLPRLFRSFLSPLTRSSASAATSTQFAQSEYPTYFCQPSAEFSLESRRIPLGDELSSFFSRSVPYTILPTPLPNDCSSAATSLFITDSATQDLVSVMDACLHNLYDVPRAKSIFDSLRCRTNSPILSTRVYNTFLEAYLNMATERDLKTVWLQFAWELYEVMESERENHYPDAGTYACALLAYHRFNPESKTPVENVKMPTPNEILARIVERKIHLHDVIGDRAMPSSEEAAEIIKMLSKSAMELNLPHIVSELGQAEAIGIEMPDVLDNVPEVTPVMRVKNKPESEGCDQKMEVPFNLDNLRRHLAHVRLARRVLADDVGARQKLLEQSVYDVAVERLKYQADLLAELGLGNAALKKADLQRWLWEWHTKLTIRLEEEIKHITMTERSRSHLSEGTVLSPYLMLVKANRLSMITILEIMRLQGSGGVYDGMKTTRALISVGKAVEVEYKAQMCKKNNICIPTSPRIGDAGFFSTMGYRNLQQRRLAAVKHLDDGETWTADWTQATRLKVGSILVECLVDTAQVLRTAIDKNGNEISEIQPAFYHTYEYFRGQKLGVIRLNPVVIERLAKDRLRETLHPRHLPMLMKPKPWLGPNQGGYLYSRTSAMRFKDSAEQASYLRHASALGNVELVYAGLDVLGSTPWRINKKVFDVVLDVWNSGKRMGKLPPAIYDGPEPEVPPNMDTDIRAKTVYQQRMKAYNSDRANNHSDRCNVNYRLEIARVFLGDTIYLPHNLDFRGRAYPIPPHLNHIGDDLSRGLLKFAEAKPLGARGLRWLKIHLSNLYGFDKANFDERVAFVHEHLDDIYDSAINPLNGRLWWQKADDPWQCLATCFDLYAALESPDPHAFESSLPVHQDGTCNGLQHYAALGGDDQGAKQVNLSAADRPSDVYTHVGDMVEKMVAEDAQRGMKYGIMLRGKVSRKVVKQTVMTTVYGVTFVGAREQIERQLRDKKELPEEECWGASAYLAKKVIFCIGDLFTGATDIQNWLNLSARIISKSIPSERLPEALAEHPLATRKRPKSLPLGDRLKREQMTSVVWTTPLGLPVVQPYRKISRKQVLTRLQTVFISDPNSPAEVNTVKQASAFPPNFIHSLDATHMMLTALECRTQQLTFASVHDSYWTHAASIDKMSEIIRETFVALHSSDVLIKLREEFMERYQGYKIPLTSIRNTALMKKLYKAGSRIIVTPEQAKSLSAVDDLLEVSETRTPTIDESQAKIINADNISAPEEFWPTAVDPVDKDSCSLHSEEQTESTKKKLSRIRRKSKAMTAAEKQQAQAQLAGKFVNVTDIMPPLPKKGDFDVDRIKGSQYFFS